MTSTDTAKDELVAQLLADPDFLDTLRTATRARAERPFFNMAGERIGINPLATTGRVQVSPGQTISSASWGNPVWDQSINCFDNAAARDSQWPSPHDGSVCYLADGTGLWARRAGVWRGLPMGYMAQAVGPATQTDSAAGGVTLVSVTVPTIAGRRYRISTFAVGTQVSTASTSYYQVLGPTDLGYQRFAMVVSAAVGAVIMGTGVNTYLAAASGNQTWGVQSVGSTLRTTPSSAQVTVEDIGS